MLPREQAGLYMGRRPHNSPQITAGPRLSLMDHRLLGQQVQGYPHGHQAWAGAVVTLGLNRPSGDSGIFQSQAPL